MAADFDQCRNMFPGGTPPLWLDQAMKPRASCYDGFAVLHCGASKTPCYVAEVLDADRIKRAKGKPRANRFFADARLPASERATLADYAGEHGIDRGHMAPAGDMDTDNAMEQCFTLANIVPQDSHNNEHQWKGIESATRSYVTRATGKVYVITGPVFSRNHRSIGPGQVWVPDHLFKVVYDETTQRAWAHWIDNTADAKVSAPISYAALVHRLGVNLLPHARIVDDASQTQAASLTQDQPGADKNDPSCHVGPQGGHYRINHGKKRYGC